MSNMAEVNGIDHLVRHEKETKLKGYDNEGFHSHERSEDEEESASDDDRLRSVVTENGHRPEDDSPLSNGHVRDESNGRPTTTTVNGSAVIVVEEGGGKGDSDMNDGDGGSFQKPLDTRLHHFVPVDDIDRKILNGSSDSTTCVTIPEDAVIDFTTGRVRVKKGASNNPQQTNDRESIPLETMLPSYEPEDKAGLGEKAELEAELANHKNGLWSTEGHNAYGSPDAPFGNSEKLNGTSKSSDEISLPVSNHRKCLSSDVSDTSSEQKSTGEKLYFTEESRKVCPGWRRIIVCGLILIIIAVAIMLGAFAATGILLSKSESKNTKYESGHSLPSIDSISHAGHSFRPRPSSKVPHKFLPPVTEDADLPPNSTMGGVGDTVSRLPLPTVTSKVPLLNDSSHSQTIVPNALVGEFTIDENFTEDLKDKTSEGYQSLAKYIERELHGIFKRNGGVFEDLKILNFSPGSIKIKFVTIWASDHNVILSQKAVEILKSYLSKNRNSLLAYPVDVNSIHFIDVFDECKVQKGGCSFKCVWDYNTLTKACLCEKNMMLLEDGKSCGLKPLTSSSEITTPKLIYTSPSTITTSVTELPLLTKESPATTLEQPNTNIQTTTEIPDIITKVIVTFSELFNDLASTESTPSEIVSPYNQNVTLIREFSTAVLETTEPVTEESTSLRNLVFVNNSLETVDGTTTEMPSTTNDQISESNNSTISKAFDTTEYFNIVSNLSLGLTTSTLELETTTAESTISSPTWNISNYTESDILTANNTEGENNVTLTTPLTTRETTTTTTTVFEENVTTIGYHIIEETTEMYTLKGDSDYDFDTVNKTTPVPTTTEKSETTSPTITLQTTVIPGHSTEVTLTTEIPVEESSKDSTVSEMIEFDTTEMSKAHTVYTTINTEAALYYTTTKPEENFTDIVDLKMGTDNILSETDLNGNGTIFTTPVVTSNETKDFETTTDFSVTTISSLSPVIHQFNRTPEVRSFDDDVQNDTSTLAPDSDILFSTVGIISEASTEINNYADNFSTIEALLTSSPFTTTLPTIEPLSVTTLHVNASKESDILSTTIDTITENISEHEHESITSTEKKIDTTFADFPAMDAETEVNTEPVSEFSTQNHQSFSIIHDILNDTSDVTIPFKENEFTTLSPIETEYNNETTELTVNSEAMMNESLVVQNSTEINTNLASFDTSKNKTINTPSSTEITETLPTTNETTDSIYNETTENIYNDTTENVYNETTESIYNNTTENVYNETAINSYNETKKNINNETIEDLHNESTINLNDETVNLYNGTTEEHFETTISYIENGNDTIFSENFSTEGDSKSSIELNNTENSLLFTTSEPIDILNNQTIIAVTIENDDLNKSNISEDEITENETLVNSTNSTYTNNSEETYTLTTVQDFSFPTPPTYTNESDENTTVEPYYDAEIITTVEYSNNTLYPDDLGYDSNFTHTINITYENSFEEINSTLLPNTNDSTENGTFNDDFGNFTTDGYENITNETTTNASTGIECREDQFLCESLNKCINDTFMCDGIEDCPDGQDEFECKDTCHSNFMCANSSTCIMSDARCDGIWDCENGTDEENCTPTECAKHEVMCLDGSKCIKPGHICDWKYNCLDRSDEVGCVERTTCESGGRFFCNDGLCIPWSLKCDGEHDCKEGEDEGNCTCLNDEFQCNDGKCLKSSSRCDGHQDCHDAEDEMGCVNVDTQHIVSTYEPYSGTWGMLCAEDWNLDDGQYLCQELGFGHALGIDRVHVSFNGTWMAMRRENLTEASLWTERVSFVESCTSGLAAMVECQKFACGEYIGLLHRRRRDVISSSSSNQLPFIGYTSTFHSNKGCLSEILTPIWLITSAECLLSISKEPFNGSDWYVRTSIGRDVEVDVAQNHEVLRIITHPHSSKFRSLTLRDYDVALIRLKHALVFVSDKIGAICPPDEQVPPGITCFSGVLGTEKPRAPPPDVLTINSLALQIIDGRNCNRVDHFNNTVNHRMLCTQSSEGHTICDNDEGTPLMCLSGINKWYLAGMLTYQRFCDVYSKHPAVFSNLFSMRKYLDQVTGQKQYEIPYDNSVYTIIPPTTPSPTLPETTTTIMTTEITTESMLTDLSYLTTLEYENKTEGVLEEINGTTVAYEELAREENDSAILYSEFKTDLPNVTFNEMLYDNETVTIPYGTDYDVINTTSVVLEEAKDEILANKTHSYLTSVLNDTYRNDDLNTTDISIMDNNTAFNNATSYLPETTVSIDLTDMTASEELNSTTDITTFLTSSEIDVTTISSIDVTETPMNESVMDGETIIDTVTPDHTSINSTLDDSIDNSNFMLSNFSESTTDISLISALNESSETFKPISALTNESVSTNHSLVSLINDTIEIERGNFSESTTTEMPLISIFNESLEMFKPIIALTNENISVSQPLISLINETTENFDQGTTTDIPLISIFNESLEIFKPMIVLTNENISISQPLASLTNDTTEVENFGEVTTTDMPLISIFNESSEMFKPMIALTNENMSISQPLANDTTEVQNFDEVTTTDIPLISIFNESLEIFKPLIPLTNENISISQPLLSLISERTAKVDEGNFETSALKTSENSTENISAESTSVDSSTNTHDEIAMIETTVTPITKALPFEAETEMKATDSPLSDATETFTFEIEGEPHTDLAFSVFKNSDKLKFEPLLENSDISEKHASTLENQNDTNITTNFPYLNETALPPVTSVSLRYVSNTTEINVLEFHNITKETNYTEMDFTTPTIAERTDYTTLTAAERTMTTERINYTIPRTTERIDYTTPTTAERIDYTTPMTTEKIDHTTPTNAEGIDYTTHTTGERIDFTTPMTAKRIDYTTPMTTEVTTETENTTLTDIEHFENITNILEVITDSYAVEDPVIKKHLISEELLVLLDNSTFHNITECGLWENNFASAHNESEDFFMKWPALGYLQMTSEIKICPSAVISDKFVITSLNCLITRDKDLDPEKWTYTGGLYQSNITDNGIQRHEVKKIIPYPDPSTSFFLNQHDIVLVRVKDTIRFDQYSKSVCLPGDDASFGKECFITGWNKNASDDDLRKQFYSTTLSIISTNECNNTMNYNGVLLDDLICGSHNESTHVCQMDFGTPLFCLNENKHWEIHGILNFPGPCDMTRPAVFSSILSIKKWITNSLTNEKLLN